MTHEQIGGHDNDAGRMLVYRAGRWIVKVAYDAENAAALGNEARVLATINAPWAPALVDVVGAPHATFGGVAYTVQEDVGPSEAVTADSNDLRRAMIRLLAAIRAAGLRHGDLTGPNVMIRDGGARLVAVDWQESHPLGSIAPQKSPWSDGYFACRWIAGTADRDGGLDTPRVARRWQAVLGSLDVDRYSPGAPLALAGGTLVDYGCFQGDFVALAATEGMEAVGIDRGGFRTGEDSIAIGQDLWAGWPDVGRIELERADMIDAIRPAEVAICFSTWPYMVAEYGRDRATAWIRDVIAASEIVFFETQLAGDGPGPEFLATHDDVGALLMECGAARAVEIGRFPVEGRPAHRSVWRAERAVREVSE